MAEFSDSPPSNPSSSPKLAKPSQTLDESSPTAPIRDLIANSLSLSSPIRQIQAYSPAKPDGSSSSQSNKALILNSEENRDMNPYGFDKTLITPSEENKFSDSQITAPAQISPANNNDLLQIASTSDSYLYSRSENRPSRRYNNDCQSDDDDFNKIEPTNPLPFSWWYSKFEPTGVVCFSFPLLSDFVLVQFNFISKIE